MCLMHGSACTIVKRVANVASWRVEIPKHSMPTTSKASAPIWRWLWRSGTVRCDSFIACSYWQSQSLSGVMIYAISRARLPASVISPLSSRTMHLCLFNWVRWLLGRRGDNLCASLPSGSLFSVLSIHPKQSASSTTSMYGIAGHSGGHLLR